MIENQAAYLALVHHPIENKKGEIVTTSVTNLDIHDIARSCRTYGIKKYFIVTPLKPQQELIQRLLEHWKAHEASEYNPYRQSALDLVQLVHSIDEAKDLIAHWEGECEPLVAVTGAKIDEPDGDEGSLRQKIRLDKKPLLLLFGTGYGLTSEIFQKADFRLKKIMGSAHDQYIYLSVRSAVAIYCDRLFGEKNN